MTATLTIDVMDGERARGCFGAVTGPVALTPDFVVPTGLDADLDIAVARCAANAVELLTARFGMAEEYAYAYLSAATDFDISQVVDQVKGVHARIRLADFPMRGAWSGRRRQPGARPPGGARGILAVRRRPAHERQAGS
jgi:acetamidase/formamidase